MRTPQILAAPPIRRADVRRIGLLLGCLGAVALVALSVFNVGRASTLQSILNREYALSRARAVLAEAVATPLAELHPLIEQLLRADLGFNFIGVRDRDGILLASDGIYERLNPILLLPGQVRGLRAELYQVTASTGEVPLDHAGARVGSLDFAISSTLVNNVHDRAVDRLQLSGWLGLAISLPLLAGFLLALRQRSRHGQTMLRQRLEAAPRVATTDSGGLLPLRTAAALLDVAGQGLLVVDREASVRQLNATASQLTGWSEADARGQRVYSVFHAISGDAGPRLSAAEQALRENHDIAPLACTLRARNGTLHAIEMSAALLHGNGDTVEGVAMLFRDTKK